MQDRTVRFAARMIAVGFLGVGWTIGTLALVLIQLANLPPERAWRVQLLGCLGLTPVALMLIYIVVTDYADWRLSRRGLEPAGPAAEQDE